MSCLLPDWVGTRASAEAADLSMQPAPPAPKDVMGSWAWGGGPGGCALKTACRTQLSLLLVAPWLWRLWRLGPATHQRFPLEVQSTVVSDAVPKAVPKAEPKAVGKEAGCSRTPFDINFSHDSLFQFF